MNLLNTLKNYFKPKRSSSTTSAQTTIRQLNNYEIRDFIDSLERYTIQDLQELQRVARRNEFLDMFRKKENRGNKRCSTAAASLCFAAVEQVGIILRNDLIDPANPTDTRLAREALKKGNNKNAESFFAYAKQKGVCTVDSSYLLAIYILFRNKITHNLFPAHGLAVSQDSNNNLTDLTIAINGVYSLNIKALIQCIIMVIKYLKFDITNIANYDWIQSINKTLELLENAEELNLRNKYADANTIRSYPNLQTELHRLLPAFRF